MRFLCHQLSSPLLEFMFMRYFLLSSQSNRVIEKVSPGMPSMKKGSGLPPKTLLTPGV